MKEITLTVFSFMNEVKLISLHTSIAILSTQLNYFRHCDITLIKLVNITHIFAHS